ncbi:hypothetical protein CLAIMM_07718 [Cladophialophora immunda]|nr:hypothetical protein CLAIMM_07718 [Cladophialophora immunda]
MSTIIIGTYATTSEAAFDEYTHLFEMITSLFDELLQHWNATQHQYSLLFSFDLGITPPMFFVASRCRHPQIRRKAVDFMLHSPFYHGIWPDRYSGLCAQRIVEIEERGLEAAGDSLHVPEHWRIRKVSADLQQENDQIVMQYVRSPFGPSSEIQTTFIPLRM